MKKYTIELTEEQYHLISLCVEVVHRVSVGQVEELDLIVPKKIEHEMLVKLKKQTFPELPFNASYKWCGGYRGSDSDRDNKAFSHFQAATYAIYREMLHFNAIQESHDDVYRSPTLRCDGVAIPKISIKEDEK